MPTIYYAPADPDLKGVETRQGDYVVNQLADRMNRDDLVGDIVSNWHKYGQRRKTLVFCVDVAHSVHVKDEFLKSDVRAENLDGSTPKSERDEHPCPSLASGETEVVCNCMVLTEGFDLPASAAAASRCPSLRLSARRQPDAIIFRDGELAQVRNGTAQSAYDPHVRFQSHSMLAHFAAERGYKPRWAAHKYKEKFGCWPPPRVTTPIPASPEVSNWVRGRAIAYAKAKKGAT